MKAFSLHVRRWLPVLLWIGIVLFASTSIGSSGMTTSALHPFLAWFFPDLPPPAESEVNFVVRKMAHIIQFLVFALLLWRAARIRPALRISDGRLTTLILVASAIVACLSEGIQLFFTVRSASFSDMLLDLAGAGAGTALFFIFFAKPLGKNRQSTSCK